MRTEKLQFGVVLPTGFRAELNQHRPPTENYSTIVNVATEAERLGFDSCWAYDHFYTFPVVTRAQVFDAWMVLTALSQRTSKLRLGQLVTCASYRNPALLAKMAATLDVVSGGRLDFGIGAGWYQDEFTAYGYDYPGAVSRIRKLREVVTIIKSLWTQERTSFSGKYYQIRDALSEPKPIQKPYPPILIGGLGEHTLRVVADLADRCNVDLFGLKKTEEKFELLRKICEKRGRPYDSIQKTAHRWVAIAETQAEALQMVQENYRQYAASKHAPPNFTYQDYLGSRIVGTPDQCIDQLSKYLDIGVSYFMHYFFDGTNPEHMRLYCKTVMPALRELAEKK